MESTISASDEIAYADFLAIIDDFRKREIEPLIARPENAISTKQINQVLDQTKQAGLLPQSDGAEMGLFDLLDSKQGYQFHLQTLHALAQSSASVAYALFSEALSTYINRELSLQQSQLVIFGRKGLARYALAHYLNGDALTDEEDNMLKENFYSEKHSHEKFFVQSLDFQFLTLPVFENEQLYFHTYSLDQLEIENIPLVHGLTDVPCFQVGVSKEAKAKEASKITPAFYCKILSLSQAALMAISLGASEHAYTLALEYAKIRKQGGDVIVNHPAVRNLLIKAKSSIASTKAIIGSLESASEDVTALNEIFKLRLATMPLLREGATSCLQVFGGYGYMKDYGIEKILRDVNHLSIIQGSSIELHNFVSAIEVKS